MTAPEPCAAAVEAGAVALASRYHGAKITAGTMVLYYGEAEAVLTAAWPLIVREVVEACVKVADAVEVERFERGFEDSIGAFAVAQALRALVPPTGEGVANG